MLSLLLLILLVAPIVAKEDLAGGRVTKEREDVWLWLLVSCPPMKQQHL